MAKQSKTDTDFDPWSITQTPASLPQQTTGESEGLNRLGQAIGTQSQDQSQQQTQGAPVRNARSENPSTE